MRLDIIETGKRFLSTPSKLWDFKVDPRKLTRVASYRFRIK